MTQYEHVMELAEEFRINVYFHDCNHNGGLAFPSARHVYGWHGGHTRSYDRFFTVETAPRYERGILVPRPWRSRDAYITCLHEIGHCALNHTPHKYDGDSFKCELEAWDFAIDWSMHELTLLQLNRAWDCLYRQEGWSRKKLTRWYDEWYYYIEDNARH